MVISQLSSVRPKVFGLRMGPCRARKSRCSPDHMPRYNFTLYPENLWWLYIVFLCVLCWWKLGILKIRQKLMSSIGFVCVVQAVSGRYVNQTFDPETGDFSVTFTADVMADFPPTVIYVNEKYYYPDGLTVRWDIATFYHLYVRGHGKRELYYGWNVKIKFLCFFTLKNLIFTFQPYT